MLSPVFDLLQWQEAVMDVVAGTHAPPSILASRRQKRLARLLEVARTDSALYRERLGAPTAGATQWHLVPPVSRAELMARFDDWVTDPDLKLAPLRAFTASPDRVAEPWLGKYMVWESSGTSGSPGIFVQDAQALSVYDALEAVRHRVPARTSAAFSAFDPFAPFSWFGATERYALVTATGGHFASICTLNRLQRVNPVLGAHVRSFSIQQAAEDLVAALNAFCPSVIATYPSVAAMLAEEAERGRLQARPRCVMMGGESLSDAVRARVARAFSAIVRSSYGASEFLPIAWECAHGNLHVNEDWVLLEPVDAQFQPVPRGEFSHTVLLTNLANHVQPLIRYDLGDQVCLHERPCVCGSALSVLEVRGRSDDTLRVPGRGVGQTVSLLPLALCTVLEEECGIFDFQIQQTEPGTLVLRLPQQGAEADSAIERARLALQAFAHDQGARPIQVVGESGCIVPRGRSGKACKVML